MTRLKKIYTNLRKNNFTSILLDVTFFLAMVWVIGLWQTRNLLPSDGETSAPDFSLTAIDGGTYTLADAAGETTLLYFFAPWCSVCNLSAHNLQDIEESDSDLNIWLVAIGYQNIENVQAYVKRHNLTMPVLMGDGKIARDFKIAATPTYYVLDSEGMVKAKSVGYSTEFGMRLRALDF